jgi:AcrR family transcriptional regulator
VDRACDRGGSRAVSAQSISGDPVRLAVWNDRQTPPRPPSRRVDAQRNRERILTAARAAFADPDADISMAEIARRAGVGSATLYRNFTNRRELLEALYVDEIDAVCEAAVTIDGDSPGAILEAWLHRFYAYFSSKRLVAAELLKHSDATTPCSGRAIRVCSPPVDPSCSQPATLARSRSNSPLSRSSTCSSPSPKSQEPPATARRSCRQRSRQSRRPRTPEPGHAEPPVTLLLYRQKSHRVDVIA